jgi:superfamily I DNA/RNA helicase
MRVSREAWRPQGIADLEDRAWQALREVDWNVCVVAGAGAGKSEFLAQKAAYLLQTGICPQPKKILAISFKRDAAKNLGERLKRRCLAEGPRFVSLTFDGFTKGLIDQFRAAIPAEYRPALEYQILPAGRDHFSDFLARHDAEDVAWEALDRAVANASLPIDRAPIPANLRGLVATYWQEMTASGSASFQMINRMVEWLLRTRADIRKALRATYPFVFLDEFQDTTNAQFEVVQRAFHGSRSILTAVGDDKQRIMGWAGAMPDGFASFIEVFAARKIPLVSNWRSHAELVAVQHLIAQHIDPDVEPGIPRRERQVDGDVSAIWQFRLRQAEVSFLAGWISDELDQGDIQPDQIAILVRNHPDRVEGEIGPALAASGVSLRNVARLVGGVAIQDILSDELTHVLLPFLRLGAERRNSQAWSDAQRVLESLDAVSQFDEAGLRRVRSGAEEAGRSIRRHMSDNDARLADVAALVELVIALIGEARIRQSNPVYKRSADFARSRAGFVALLAESRVGGGTWTEVLDRFEGMGQVPLMTVHKSKGLEFHTMIFFGLDDSSWWSLKPANGEELKSFFVALSRAEQRAFFTCCAERGSRIAWLERILGDAVPRVVRGAV